MLRNQKGFHLVFLVIIVTVLGLVGFAGYRVMHKNSGSLASDGRRGSGANYAALAACGSEPLGALNPPDHTMQAEHKDGDCGDKEMFASPVTYYR